MNTKALWSVTLVGTVAAFFSACGDGDSTKIKICNAKQLTCLSDTGGQICSADGTQNLAFQCGEGQRCCDPKVKDADCGEGVSKATCVGDCTPGATQCGSKGVALRCADDGRQWVPTDCPVGTGCDSDEKSDTYGTCVNSDDPENVVVICEGGTKSCADGNTAKACEPDGTNWVFTACAPNEMCDDGECVVDPAKGCVPHSGTCVDKTHIRMCNDDGDGYDKTEECPDDTTCEDGACQGPVCAVGAIRCDDVRVGPSFANAIANGTYQERTVYACNANGTAWETSTCAANEICVYDNISNNTVNSYIADILSSLRNNSSLISLPVLEVPASSRASCESPGCAAPYALRGIALAFDSGGFGNTAGSFTCGDPTSPDADPLASFSLCEGLPPFNNLYWANYACTEPEKCSYVGSQGNVEEGYNTLSPTCASSCIPGAKACINPGNGSVGNIVSVGEATVTCGEDGNWDYSTTSKCESDSREQWCGPNLMGTAGNFNVGTCMEPACAAWFASFDTFTLPEHIGACGADGMFYPCKADGTFDDAQECSDCRLATGISLPAQPSTPETFAGYEPGTCASCTDGAQRCLFSTTQLSGTPYYQVCDNGSWTTKTCSGSKLCWAYQNPEDAVASIKCGAECAPFSASCGGTDGKQIAECDADGNLGDFKNCPSGACHVDATSSTSGGTAYCEVECITGTSQCTTVIDPDTQLPVVAAATCTKKGRFDLTNATICNVNDAQNPEQCLPNVGCVQCDSGAFDGVPDVRCALDEDGLATDPAAVQVCGKNGTWEDAIDCPGSGTSCSLGVCYALEAPSGEGGAAGTTGGNTGGGGAGGVLQ
jgi:hypothetical protein